MFIIVSAYSLVVSDSVVETELIIAGDVEVVFISKSASETHTVEREERKVLAITQQMITKTFKKID